MKAKTKAVQKNGKTLVCYPIAIVDPQLHTFQVDGLCKGIEGLFKKNKVDYVIGKAKITGPNQITAALNEGGEKIITTDNIVIATGSS